MANAQTITNKEINSNRTGGGHTNLSKIAPGIHRNNHKLKSG